MPPEVDLSAWPVAVLARSPSDSDDATVLVARGDGGGVIGPILGSLLDRRERFGLVLDLGRQTDVEQADFAHWLRRNRVRAKRYVVGCALVLPDATVDRARELIGLEPDLYPFPAWVAATRGECRVWVEGVLASSGPAAGRPGRR